MFTCIRATIENSCIVVKEKNRNIHESSRIRCGIKHIVLNLSNGKILYSEVLALFFEIPQNSENRFKFQISNNRDFSEIQYQDNTERGYFLKILLKHLLFIS